MAKKKLWDVVRKLPVAKDVRYRNVHEDQQMERSEIEKPQTMFSRAVFSVVVSLLVFFTVYLFFSVAQYMLGESVLGNAVGSKDSTYATDSGGGTSGMDDGTGSAGGGSGGSVVITEDMRNAGIIGVDADGGYVYDALGPDWALPGYTLDPTPNGLRYVDPYGNVFDHAPTRRDYLRMLEDGDSVVTGSSPSDGGSQDSDIPDGSEVVWYNGIAYVYDVRPSGIKWYGTDGSSFERMPGSDGGNVSGDGSSQQVMDGNAQDDSGAVYVEGSEDSVGNSMSSGSVQSTQAGGSNQSASGPVAGLDERVAMGFAAQGDGTYLCTYGVHEGSLFDLGSIPCKELSKGEYAEIVMRDGSVVYADRKGEVIDGPLGDPNARGLSYYLRPTPAKLFVSGLLAFIVFAVLYAYMKRNLDSQNVLRNPVDINQYPNDQHIMLPEEMQLMFDYVPDMGAHFSVSPSSMISHMAISNKGLNHVRVARHAREDIIDKKTGEVKFLKGELITDDDGNVIYDDMPMIDEAYMHALYDASGCPEGDEFRIFYDPRKIDYNSDGKNRDKAKYDSLADLINADWEMPEYEPQRPAGVYLVDTAPTNTMVLAITRAGKGGRKFGPFTSLFHYQWGMC